MRDERRKKKIKKSKKDGDERSSQFVRFLVEQTYQEPCPP
jgi:hypothetical protein